jgi:hypothetical protein
LFIKILYCNFELLKQKKYNNMKKILVLGYLGCTILASSCSCERDTRYVERPVVQQPVVVEQPIYEQPPVVVAQPPVVVHHNNSGFVEGMVAGHIMSNMGRSSYKTVIVNKTVVNRNQPVYSGASSYRSNYGSNKVGSSYNYNKTYSSRPSYSSGSSYKSSSSSSYRSSGSRSYSGRRK